MVELSRIESIKHKNIVFSVGMSTHLSASAADATFEMDSASRVGLIANIGSDFSSIRVGSLQNIVWLILILWSQLAAIYTRANWRCDFYRTLYALEPVGGGGGCGWSSGSARPPISASKKAEFFIAFGRLRLRQLEAQKWSKVIRD